MKNSAEIKNFINENNYDIQLTTSYGRWIDQKCTPDVLCIIADCIINYVTSQGENAEFNSVKIWKNEYTKEFVEEIFSKPGTDHEKSSNEYDKFFSQPMELLAVSNILNKKKVGNKNYYTVNNFEILEYISMREKNAITFLNIYIKKVLKDSGLWPDFKKFFDIQTQEAYFELKSIFEEYIIKYTKINNVTEVRRIFAKVINPLAYKYKKFGTSRGRIAKQIITYSSLMYNQENFRDLYAEKPKNMTRQEWKEQSKLKINVDYYKYQSIKAKRQLKMYNDSRRNGLSEVNDEYCQGKATQVHHIFPQHQFIEIASHLENLICLTPTQHFYKAHPNNNNQIIDYGYQEVMLKAKTNIIQEDIELYGVDSIYEFSQLVEVINRGFGKDMHIEDYNFLEVMNAITIYYENL
jgi:hypothetical protein